MITGRSLQVARREAHLTQDAAAAAIGVSPRALRGWESMPDAVIPPKRWPAIAEVLPDARQQALEAPQSAVPDFGAQAAELARIAALPGTHPAIRPHLRAAAKALMVAQEEMERAAVSTPEFSEEEVAAFQAEVIARLDQFDNHEVAIAAAALNALPRRSSADRDRLIAAVIESERRMKEHTDE